MKGSRGSAKNQEPAQGEAQFPVYVLTKDSGDVDIFPSYGVMKADIEPIDVENNEYEAYDAEGHVLQLEVGEPRSAWLKLHRTAQQLSTADFWELKFNGVSHREPEPLMRKLRRKLGLMND